MARKGRSLGPINVSLGCFLIGVAVLVVLPNFRSGPHTGPRNACINNLRQLDGAAEQWRLENNRATNYCPSFEQLRSYLLHPVKCAQGGSYSFDTNTGVPKCSFPGHVLP